MIKLKIFVVPIIVLSVVHVAAFADSATLLPAQPATDADYYDDGRPLASKVELGRVLFFDKVLSGNRNISCASCHHPSQSSGDGLALPFGEGAKGLGNERRPGDTVATAVTGRVPRNSPALFNLGAREFERLFHDGRVESDSHGYFEGGFVTPAKWKLPTGLENPLAAQAMFPVTSPIEMAGQKGENEIADAVSMNNAAGSNGAWALLADRLRAIPEYVELFAAAYPEEIASPADINFVHAANAIAAFEGTAFRADDSAFDRYLRGDRTALNENAIAGMELFYGQAGCSGCHSGTFQTDHDFHAIAMPQIGPGKNDGNDASYASASGISAMVEDFGRGRVTYRAEDNYKFRTPSLRNVEHTGPWGHDGAYVELEAVVRHHLDPIRSLESYDPTIAGLPPTGRLVEVTATGSRLNQTWVSDGRAAGFALKDSWVQNSESLRKRIAEANELVANSLTDRDVADLMAFLRSLSDLDDQEMQALVPDRVPSGLPVAD